MSNDPRVLLNIGLGVISREMMRIDAASQENGTILASQRDDLCAYMHVLHKLIGKNLGDDDTLSEMTEEELLEAVKSHVGVEQPSGKNKRRRNQSSQNATGG